ncbi:MAG: hypothetical protein JXA73_24510 [Acidobacteria bacterium]|nr:hypothetical protein [Acidobacteriota bacterium]
MTTINFGILYALAILEIGMRRIAYFNAIVHPTVEGGCSGFVKPSKGKTSCYRIHDRDSLYSVEPDRTIKSMDPKILETPVRAPAMNARSKD